MQIKTNWKPCSANANRFSQPHLAHALATLQDAFEECELNKADYHAT
jgi:hypothetical protein